MVGRKAEAANANSGSEGGVVRWPVLSGRVLRWIPPLSVAQLLKSCLVHFSFICLCIHVWFQKLEVTKKKIEKKI